MNDNEPWKIKEKAALEAVMIPAVEKLLNIALHLQPFLPGTAEKIIAQFTGESIQTKEPYFRRIM
jgi:methionyl-tRNA synthetase